MNAPVIHHGDCIEVMRGMADNSIDAIVTDPPYSLSFMGRTWDTHDTPLGFQEWCQEWATEALRILKPGGFMASFGGTRTFHRLAVGIEDAGFQVRDSIGYGHSLLAWVHGQGFPKGKNALKPAWEPIVLARKPLVGTVSANVTAHGTGALNIDACRITAAPGDYAHPGNDNRSQTTTAYGTFDREGRQAPPHASGRWPANVALDEDQAAALDQQSGETSYNPRGVFGKQRVDQPSDTSAPFAVRKSGDGIFGYGDKGGASRFFYVARKDNECDPSTESPASPSPKANPSPRSGSETDTHAQAAVSSPDTPPRRGATHGNATSASSTSSSPSEIDARFLYAPKAPAKERPKVDGIAHPTVKPLALMRWLIRLVTPPRPGTVLDPFAGSGTTIEAAMLEGFNVIGIEREADYLPLIQARIDRNTYEQPDRRYSVTPPGLFDLDGEASA